MSIHAVSTIIIIIGGIATAACFVRIFAGAFRLIIDMFRSGEMETHVDHYDKLTNIDDKAWDFGNEMAEPKNRYFKGTNIHASGIHYQTYEENKRFGWLIKLTLAAISLILFGCALNGKGPAIVFGLIFGMFCLMAACLDSTRDILKDEEAGIDVSERSHGVSTGKGILIWAIGTVAFIAAVYLLRRLITGI